MGDHFTHLKGREALIYISEYGLLEQYRRATGPPPTPLALAYSWVQSHKLSQGAQHTPSPWSDGELHGIELPKGPNRTRFCENENRPASSLPAGFCFFDPAFPPDQVQPPDFLGYLPPRERRATRFISKQRKRLEHIKWLRRRGNVLVDTFKRAADHGLLHSTTPQSVATTQGKLLSDRHSWEGEVLEDLDESLAHVSRLYTFSRTRYASTETLGLAHVPELRADYFELPVGSTSGWLHTPI
jgi:hypothetical protein